MTALALLLAACSSQPAEPPQNLQQTRPPAEQAPQAPPVEKIACARGDAPLTSDCALDRERISNGQLWTIRHPDGGFRRLRVVGDEVSEADGAEPLVADGDAVRIGRERYKLPAH